MQAGKRALEALNRMVHETGLIYYFWGLERRAKKCLWDEVLGQLEVARRGPPERPLADRRACHEAKLIDCDPVHRRRHVDDGRRWRRGLVEVVEVIIAVRLLLYHHHRCLAAASLGGRFSGGRASCS